MNKYKLALFTPNLTPNLPPFFRQLNRNKEINLKIFLCSKYGLDSKDSKFFSDENKSWDNSFFQGYSYEILKNYGVGVNGKFFGLINPSVVSKIFFNDFDAIVVYGYARFSSWLQVISAWLKGTPIFFQGESILLEEKNKSKWKIFIKRILLQKLFFKMVSRFLYIGEENKKFYKFYGVPSQKLFHTPYMVNNDKFIELSKELKPKKDKLREKYGLDKNGFIILFCGRLIPEKSPLDLIKAYEQVIDKTEKPISLVIVGDGDLRIKLENYINKNSIDGIKLVGFQDYKRIPEFYALSDLFILPSFYEPWGVVVNEAMSFGLPVIVSNNVGSGPDLVHHEKNGFIFSAGDYKELASYIDFFVDNQNKAKEFGNSSLKIIKKFGYDANEKGILGALKSLN